MTIIVFILTILILVLIHEFGHFIVAKKFNIKVLEFGFGIPPRAIGKKIGETIYSLNWLPIGGFVKLLGEDDDDPETSKNSRSFGMQNVWKRIAVVLAGVTMNLLLAWILFYIILGMQGFKAQIPLLVDFKFSGVTQSDEYIVIVDDVVDNSPAKQAGLKVGDRILAVNGTTIKTSQDLVDRIKAEAGREVSLTVSDVAKANQHQVPLTPRLNPPPGQGALGVALGSVAIANIEYQTPIQKILAGPVHSYNLTAFSFKVFSQTIQTAIAKKDLKPVQQTVSGPIGINSLIGEILKIKNPLIPYLELLAMLSLNLAVINVFPFPGLDGGRLAFLLWEAVTKKKVSPTIEKYIHSVGLVVLIVFILLVTASDIKKLF